MLSSEEAGIEKPSPVIFGKALSKLNLKAEEVIMIGDNEEKDILGAEAMGIKSYLIK
jgi:putative hydrolase of the HAD superfamily